jgi:phosphoribosylglycinamide formyltransferase-1
VTAGGLRVVVLVSGEGTNLQALLDQVHGREGIELVGVAGRGAGLVVLAGWMELLSPSFVRAFAGRMINVHPSLLPAFPGLRAIEQALEHGVRVTGVTVHFVDEGVDSGPIILQEPLVLPYPPRIAAVEHSIHRIEHRLLPRAVQLFARGRIRIDPDHPARVLVEDEHAGG